MTIPFRPTLSGDEFAVRHPALFALDARDGSSVALTGQARTYTRATDGTVYDALGRLITYPHSQIRVGGIKNSVSLDYEPVIPLEGAQTNLCLRSEDFGTTWVVIGTPTSTAAARTIGDLVLDLIGDDSAAALEGYSQVVTFTANAVKAVSIVLAAGTSTGGVIRLRDTTSAADRLLATITWSAGVPTVVMTTGTQIGASVALDNGAYRFEFQTTSVTAANVNQIEVYPATTAALAVANTGTVYAGGVMAVNAVLTSNYIKTLGSTVIRNADALSYDAKWPLQDEVWFLRIERPRWASFTGTLTDAYLASRGATGARLGLRFIAATRTLQAEVHDGTTQQQQTVAMPAGTGGFLDLAVHFADLKTAARCRMDVGSGWGAYSTATGAYTSLTATQVVGDAAWAAGNQLYSGLQTLLVVSAVQSVPTYAALQALRYA